MPVKEQNFYHVRLDAANKAKLEQIVKITRRSLAKEANIAVETYEPPFFVGVTSRSTGSSCNLVAEATADGNEAPMVVSGPNKKGNGVAETTPCKE